MKIATIIILGVFCWTGMNGQCNPISDNMSILDTWDNPHTTVKYNDVWAYVASDGSEYAILGGRDSIFILNVSDPTDIQLAQAIDQDDFSSWRDFKVYGDHLYSIVDNGTNVVHGIVVYDLSGLPTTVTKVKEVNTEFGRCHNIYIDEPNARIYAVGMPGGTDLCVYSLLDPADPTLLNCYDLDTISTGSPDKFYIHDIFVKDNIAYCGHGYTGYYIWDLNDIDNVIELGSIDNTHFDDGYVHSSWNSDDDNHAIVATEVGSDPKLYWIDQSNPAAITVLDSYKEPLCEDPANQNRKRPHNPYIIGDKIYLSNYEDGLVVLEIDFDQDTIGRVGHYDTFADNDDYSPGFEGCWGAYPYLPSGTILASDITYGLYTLTYDGPPTYTFLGPGTNYELASNWYNNEKPPESFTGSVIISSDCETLVGGGTLPMNATFVVNTGAKFIQK